MLATLASSRASYFVCMTSRQTDRQNRHAYVDEQYVVQECADPLTFPLATTSS